MLAWKGAVSARQQAIRRTREIVNGGKSPEAAGLFEDLTRATRELSELSQTVPSASQREEHQRRLAKLSDRIEQLERSLASASREFRQALDERQRTPADVQKSLPADAVLVDLLECGYYVPPKEKGQRPRDERHLVAFVVRSDGPIRRIDLGPAQTITAAIERWRASF
ncbi:MAG TPA: hypothetical protein VGY55_17490, partial [Pirellulales bacterium]|nr:hypothetical protein [Pirellulales bacterium]